MAGSSAASFFRRGIYVLIVLFFVTLLPIVIGGWRFFGDERLYADAAMRMVQKGDYFTPYYAFDDGLPHFNKPILSYWAVLVSYKLFGISFFSSRLPFLLGGCLLLWLTHRASLSLFRSPEEALVAAAMLFSNVVLLTSSVRSTPDILQCLFLTASLYGFLNLIVNRDRSALHYVLAYVGAALAVETKGIPGLFPPAYAFLFCLLYRKGTRPGELIDRKSILLAVGIALFWFVVIFCKHGTVAFVGHRTVDDGFFADQITDNLGESKSHSHHPILNNSAFYLWSTASHFFPWSALILLALARDWKVAKQFWQENKTTCCFVLGWYLILFLTFTPAKFVRGRYLFPAYPLLCVLGSHFLVKVLQEGRSARLIRAICGWILALGAVCGLLLTAAGFVIDPRIVAGGIMALVVTALLYVVLYRGNQKPVLVALGIFVFLVLGVLEVSLRPVFSASPAADLTRRLQQPDLKGMKIGAVDVPLLHAGSQIRSLSGGRLEAMNLSPKMSQDQLEEYPVLIVSDTYRQHWNSQGYRMEPCGYAYPRWAFADFVTLIRSGDPQAVFSRLKIPYYIAIRETLPKR